VQYISVYTDEGISPASLRQLIKSLQMELIPKRALIRRIRARDIIGTPWEKNTDLLIVPGGEDIYYDRELGEVGAKRIADYVKNGGKYLGICAGAYFATDSFEFEKGGELEICAERKLKFFPGTAIGSALGINRYKPGTENGAEAAYVEFNDIPFYTYYNGGCFFKEAGQYENVKVLGRYLTLEDKPAAIIACKIGKGVAVLTGVHIEYRADFLKNRSLYPDLFLRALIESEPERRKAFREILSTLGLVLATT
jgi:glutamine amidotransferase-like uncharacterized protein